MYHDTDIRGGFFGTVHYDNEGKETYFEEKGKTVTLEEILCSLEDNEITWRVSFDYIGSKKSFDIPRNSIAEKKLASFLQGKGADVTARTFNCFVDSMRLQENQKCGGTNTFQRLGWIKLPVNGAFEYHYRCTKLLGGLNAEYTGNLVLKPKGKLADWKEMIETDVLGRPQLETIVLAALSAPIVGLHGINATTDNPIYHINCRSGRGKSTASALATSVSGEPFEGMRTDYDSHGVQKQYSSVYGSWGATPKATISSHSGNRGVVVVLNELGKFVGGDMTTVIFNLSEGSDIKRLNTQLQTLVTEGFNTVFISNGEMSLIGRCKSKLEGIKNRVMEISVPMTEDAEHARRIQSGSVANNGFAAPMMANYIIHNGGYSMIQEMYQQTLSELVASAPQGISGRFIEKFPTFLVMAAKIAKEALQIEFNINSVVSFCYECAQKVAEEEGEIDSSYADVIGECSTNVKNFFNRGQSFTPQPLWGAVSYPNRKEGDKLVVAEYALKKNILKELLEKHGHPNMNTCLNIWKEAGVLNHEEGRNTRSRKLSLDTPTEDVYVLKVLQDAPKESSSKKKNSKILELLKSEVEDQDIKDEKQEDVHNDEILA